MRHPPGGPRNCPADWNLQAANGWDGWHVCLHACPHFVHTFDGDLTLKTKVHFCYVWHRIYHFFMQVNAGDLWAVDVPLTTEAYSSNMEVQRLHQKHTHTRFPEHVCLEMSDSRQISICECTDVSQHRNYQIQKPIKEQMDQQCKEPMHDCWPAKIREVD